MKPIAIGLTAGDPNGIGPEVALQAALQPQPANRRLVLIGHRCVWERTAKQLRRKCPPEILTLEAPLPRCSTWDPGMTLPPAHRPGKVRADAARAAYGCILAATAAAQNQRIDAIVTAPICKEGFALAGLRDPGHTELLARLTGTRRYAMMLFGEKLRVVLATRHLPLRKVADALTADAVCRGHRDARARPPVDGLHARAHRRLRTQSPRRRRRRARQRRKNRHRPHHRPGPPQRMERHRPHPRRHDFPPAPRRAYDAVVAMYHDQGLGPMKMLSFDSGVNLTLGLPIVRTSPDHGTAFDLAGKNKANPSSTRAALDWAARLAARPNPWA